MTLARVLSESQVERVHAAAEELLSDVGFTLQDEQALKMLAARGAKVNEANGLVRLPAPLLRELVAQAPSEYTIKTIGGEQHHVGDGKQRCNAIVTDPWIIDYETQSPRRPCLEDIRRNTIVANQIESVAEMSCMDHPVTDVPGPASNLRAWETHLLHTDKHCLLMSANPESERRWRDIVAILARDNDPTTARLFTMAAAIVSPLTITGLNVDIVRMAIEYDAPVVPTICPMAGSTSPYTMASTLALCHAESLFLAALVQAFKPGHPFVSLTGPSVTDMRSGHDLYYTIDKVLWGPAAVQLSKYCNLPTATHHCGSMTHRYDPQNGAEGMLFMLGAVECEADMLSSFGSTYTAMGMSAEMMIMQEAWMKASQYMVKGICTDDLHLGFDNFKQAGPGGNFLTDDLTLQYMHGGEFFDNDIFDNAACGEVGRSMLERAHDRVEQLVDGYESSVPEDVHEGLKRYFHDECTRVEA